MTIGAGAAGYWLARVRELCDEWVSVFGDKETVANANIGRVVKLVRAACDALNALEKG